MAGFDTRLSWENLRFSGESGKSKSLTLGPTLDAAAVKDLVSRAALFRSRMSSMFR